MIATINGNVRGCQEIKSSKGTFYMYQVEMRDRNGVPYFQRVMSMRQGRKDGEQSIKVSISNGRNKDGSIRAGFRVWEVDGQK